MQVNFTNVYIASNFHKQLRGANNDRREINVHESAGFFRVMHVYFLYSGIIKLSVPAHML